MLRVSTRRTVAFVTCSEYPDGHPDDLLAVPPLAAAGVDVEVAVWDDPNVEWERHQLTVLRSTWDYAARRDEFLAWAAGMAHLANPLAAVTWSSDKHYLADLAAAGVPTVPTLFVEPGDGGTGVDAAVANVARDPAGFVVKPSIGAGSVDAGRYPAGDIDDFGAGHVRILVAGGRSAMLQPYLASVDHTGETALIYVGGDFSHAVRKEALLTGPADEVDGLFKEERIAAAEPTSLQLAVGVAALDACPVTPESLLYGRVDLLDGPDGDPIVLEIELVEPSLFLSDGDRAVDRFAAAIVEWLDRHGPQW